MLCCALDPADAVRVSVCTAPASLPRPAEIVATVVAPTDLRKFLRWSSIGIGFAVFKYGTLLTRDQSQKHFDNDGIGDIDKERPNHGNNQERKG